MTKRFVSIWFRHLITDWFTLSQHEFAIRSGKPDRDLKNLPFVLRGPSHGRMLITAANAVAQHQGIVSGMVVTDARAILPDLEVLDDQPGLAEKLLKRLSEWCIRFTPIVAIDPPDGLLFDSTGCSHLWGGDELYVREIIKRLNARGYDVRVAMADTIGAAWGIARFGKEPLVTIGGKHVEALLGLPPEAIRLEGETVERLHKLGLHRIGQFIQMPRSALRRRFGPHLIMRLNMATGVEIETIVGIHIVAHFQERLPCLEPMVTLTSIEVALRQLLESLCLRLRQEQKGLRTAAFKCYRVDGKIETIAIETNRPSHHISHLYKLFELKLSTIEPGLGIELFVLEALKVEDHYSQQEKMWVGCNGLEDVRLSELIDRIATRLGTTVVHRYLPDEHFWPERSFKTATSLQEKPMTSWRVEKLRPIELLATPETIEVTAPIPDYPPMLFRYQGKLHNIVKADGPERIEQEWWLQEGQHRDYYRVEDAEGNRYWLFRLGHYHDETYQWFIHGFFP